MVGTFVYIPDDPKLMITFHSLNMIRIFEKVKGSCS